jgi:DNA repair exonuclease SbcCD nuclease subunit
VFIVHGNHDPADGWSAGFALPPSVHVFSAREVERVPFERDGEAVAALYGRSFPTQRVVERYARDFRRAPEDAGLLAVGVLHTNVGGTAGYEDYALSSLDDLAAAGMDYWALGHIHLPGRVLEHPRAVYAGCPQGLQPNEDGPRGCYVVTWDGRTAEEEFVELSPLRWAQRTLQAGELADVASLEDALSALADEARAEAGRPVLLRVTLAGRGPLHAELARPGVLAGVLADVREEQLVRSPWLWLDHLKDATAPPLDLERRDGFEGALIAPAEEYAERPEALAEEVGSLVDAARGRLVARPDLESTPEELLRRARDLALDLLAGEA